MAATKRQAQKAETRARLIEAARRVFAEQGFEQVGVRDIAQAAGVSTGALFFNFAGKEALWAAAMDRPAPDVRAFLAELIAHGSPSAVDAAAAMHRDLYGESAA